MKSDGRLLTIQNVGQVTGILGDAMDLKRDRHKRFVRRALRVTVAGRGKTAEFAPSEFSMRHTIGHRRFATRYYTEDKETDKNKITGASLAQPPFIIGCARRTHIVTLLHCSSLGERSVPWQQYA